MAVAQVVGATGQFEDCCEGRLLGRDHSPECPRLLAIQFTPTSRDEEIAMALQAAELRDSPEQVEMAPGPVTYSMVDPVWGEVLKQEPSCAFRCCFSCCPCCVIGCRTPEAKKAWRRFLFSMSFMLSMVQVMILVVVIALDGGFISYEENPMLGPHFHRLDAAGAKNAAKIANGEVWRLASATMLHAGWIHLVGNILVQIRAGVQLEIIWGTPAWLLIYFSSGIYANFLSCVLHPGALGVGSSGCLCGLIGGWLSFLLITWNQTMPNDVKMRNAQTSSILISIVLVVVFSFFPLMDLAAHIGGLLMGVGVCMTIFGNRLQDPRYKWATIAIGFVSCLTLWIVTYALFVNVRIPQGLLDLCQRPNC